MFKRYEDEHVHCPPLRAPRWREDDACSHRIVLQHNEDGSKKRKLETDVDVGSRDHSERELTRSRQGCGFFLLSSLLLFFFP